MNLEENKWFVVRTNPRAEKRVANRLTTLNITHYLPLYKTVKQWHDRKKRVEEPLIKGYIFVNLSEKTRHQVFDIPGIVRYLYVHGKIAEIKEIEIENLKKFCKFEDIVIEKGNHVMGDEVEIIMGDLIGLRGKIKETAKGNFLFLHIVELGFFASIKINKSDVRVLK